MVDQYMSGDLVEKLPLGDPGSMKEHPLNYVHAAYNGENIDHSLSS
jgi:hypothetical protein